MLSEDAKAIIASNLTIAMAILVTSGWGEEDKEHKHLPPKVTIETWLREFEVE